MVDCKRLFEEFRTRLLCTDSEIGGKKQYKAWCRLEYKHQVRPDGLKPEKTLPKKRNGGRVGGDERQSGVSVPSIQPSGDGSAEANGRNDISVGKNADGSDKPVLRAGARIYSDEFRHVLCSPLVETVVAWDELDEREDYQISLYAILAVGGVIRIKDIPKIPYEYDNFADTEFFGIDTEDNSFGLPHFYQFATRDEVFITSTWPVMMAFLSRNNIVPDKHVVWGTNIEYELGNIVKHWPVSSQTLEVRWSKANLTKYDVRLRHDNHDWMDKKDLALTLKIWDTLNHWKKGVKDLGKTLTDKLNYDFGKLSFDPYSLKYAAMDAIISRSYASVQRAYYKKKNLKLLFTPGATALATYTTGYDDEGNQFCKHKLYNSHDEAELTWLIGALRGGRTEVFSLKEYTDKVGYYDINSAYPYAMKLGSFPNITWHKWEKGHGAIEKLIKGKMEGVVECDVDATNLVGFAAHIPYLGTVDIKNNRFIFPLGQWRGKYTFFEIRKAILLGYKFKYIEACFYSVCNQQPFKEYVDFCYAIRDEGTALKDPMLRDIGKSLGNNLFGKFGQRMQNSVLMDIDKCSPEELEGVITIDDAAIVKQDDGFAKHTNVVWSAYITAMCRDLLYNHMLNAWAAGNEIIYCDTDSIFIHGGSPPASHQTQLGALKHEGDLSYFRAYLPKVYAYEFTDNSREFKAKGVPKAERERFIIQGLAEYKKPMKVREALRRKTFVTDEPVEVGIPAINAWVNVSKELKGAYTKRKVLKDLSTEALCLIKKDEKQK